MQNQTKKYLTEIMMGMRNLGEVKNSHVHESSLVGSGHLLW